AGAPLMLTARGAASVTVMVLLAVPVAPSWAVTTRVTTYVPAIVGVPLKFGVVAEPNGTPSLVTLQLQLKPAAISVGLGLVIVLVREIGVPTWQLAGAPLMVTLGGTSWTVTWSALCPTWLWTSVTVSVTVKVPLLT